MGKARTFKSTRRQPWLIIFSDLMTLMLTFFVLMSALAVMDESRRLRVVESVHYVFGLPDHKYLLKLPEDADGLSRPGVSRREDAALHESAQLVASDEPNASVRYTETELIISLQGDLLFSEGGVTLSRPGKLALERLLPVLLRLEFPMLIAGYSAPGVGEGNISGLGDSRVVDSSWDLSLERSLAVYKHLAAYGVDKGMMRMEAYGSHRPRYADGTAEGRRKNRRVDLVLDRRNPSVRAAFESLQPLPGRGQEYFFRNFRFNLDLPEEAERNGGGR